MKRQKIYFLAIVYFVFCNYHIFSQNTPSPEKANQLYQQGEYEKSAKAFRELAGFWEKLANLDSQQYYQFWEAKSFIQIYEYTKAKAVLKPLVGEGQKRAKAILASSVFHELGTVSFAEGKYEEALEYLSKGIDIETSHTETDSLKLAKSYGLKGIIMLQQGEVEGAKKWVMEAHQLRKAVLGDDDLELGYSANTLYMVLSEIGEVEEGGKAIAEAWRIFSKQLPEAHPHLAIVANNYSGHLTEIGEPQHAKELMLKAIASNQSGNRAYPLIPNYVNLGLLYLKLGEHATALTYYKEAWAIADTLLPYPHQDRATILDAMGAAIYDAGLFLKEADSLFNKSLQEKLGLYQAGHPGIAQSYYNLGMVAEVAGQGNTAREYFVKSEEIRRKQLGAGHPKRADALFKLAVLQWEGGQHGLALENWRETLGIYQKNFGLSHSHTLENILQLAEVYYQNQQADSLGHYLKLAWGSVCGQDGALRDFSQLENLQIKETGPLVLQLANFHLAIVLGENFELPADQGFVAARMVVGLVHEWLPMFLSLFNDETGGEKLAEEVQQLYQKGALLAHMALQRDLGDRETWEQLLLDCIQASRGKTIQTAFRDREAISFAGVPDSLVQRGQMLREQLRYLYGHILEEAKEDGSVVDASARQLALFQDWQNYQLELQQQYPGYYQARFATSSVTPAELRAELAKNSHSLLAYFHMDTVLLATHINGTSLETVLLHMPVGWQDSLYTYRQLIEAQADLPRQAGLGNFLYKCLWEPLAEPLGFQVRVLPDGPLYYLNFETLLSKNISHREPLSNWPYLIRDHCIYYAHTLMGAENNKGIQVGNMLGIAPGFTQQLKAAYQEKLPSGQLPDSVFLNWLRTPWSAAFVESFPKKGWGQGLVEAAATEGQYLEMAPIASVLHFGTHARLENKNPLQSFLALTPDPQSQEDGYLYTYELYNRPLEAGLAVLTACETGLGSFRRGEGVLSLAHAFRYAGCPSVVYSLWSIDDEQSNQIIGQFYENLQNGASMAEALRLAKLAYLDGPGESYKTPYYWAGLVLTGDDQRVGNKSFWAANGNLWIVFGVGLCFVFGWRFFWKKQRDKGL